MNKNFYVTTPIFYPTGLPHIGTAYTVFIADVLARYHRYLGEDTFFLAGMDEHGANIETKARELNKSPKDYVDGIANEYRQIWQELGASNDYFIQTTHPEHEKFAAELLQKSYENGDVYEGSYSGWYCQSCEAYYTEEDLVDGKCPNHPTKEPVWTEEKNYYFRWSKYQDWLLEFYEQYPEFIVPEKWFEYVKSFVKAGLKDIPVTRANVKWGVPVPFAPDQTIYVWYDALPNYLSILHFEQFAGKDYFQKFWPEVRHVIGKDIIKFHAILWPAMLKSAGYEPPKQVITHGFFTVNGQKIGKSNNNTINPLEIAEKYGNDAVRYALLSEFQLGNDGDFSFERLESKYSSDLANNWGNLLNRVIHLSNSIEVSEVEDAFKSQIDVKVAAYHQLMGKIKLFEAIQLVNDLAAWGNQYISEQKPWENKEVAPQVLGNLLYLLDIVAQLYSPFLPESADKAIAALEKREKIILFAKLD